VRVLIAAILEKITLAMVERFSASQFWNQARRYRVTHISLPGRRAADAAQAAGAR
jgi:crotonobetaine/carnitine-CoA ligase